ncbi:Alpha/Beta hydrolase protein [Cyathus striatus]|nr:Alpha/Beta hydrolase protein [Cyathus striatus]
MSTAVSAKNRSSVYKFSMKAAFYVFLTYVLVVTVAMTPLVQRYVLFAHHIYSLSHPHFARPEDHGLAPAKTINLKLSSADNTTLGAWFVFSESSYRQLYTPLSTQKTMTKDIPNALARRPTILFLHGNTGTRALPLRINVYTALTARLDSNVFAVDYRGFGDSEGTPSVDGVSMDARAAWDYLIENGAHPKDVLIVGHSLGTAIAGVLTSQLNREHVKPRGLVLMSPFSSVRKLIDHYRLFGFLPLLMPLSYIPLASRLLSWSLIHNFDTLSLISSITSPVLIAHAENDWDIPHLHASMLFQELVDTHTSKATASLQSHFVDNAQEFYVSNATIESDEDESHISRTVIEDFGTLDRFTENDKQVALLKSYSGGHDIGRIEGVQDVIADLFRLQV